MSTATRRFFSGRTLEAAVMQGATYHGISPEALAYRRVEKRHGFLKTPKGVVIEVDPDAPERPLGAAPEPVESAAPTEAPPNRPEDAAPEAPAGHPDDAAPEAPSLSPDAATPGSPAGSPDGVAPEASAARPDEARPEEPAPRPDAAARSAPPEGGRVEALSPPDAATEEVARQALAKMFAVAGVEFDVAVHQGEEQLEIDLSGPDRDLLVADRGRLLMSIQHLMPRVIRGLSGRSVPCRVDSGNFQEERAERLRRQAERSADQVRQSHRPWTFEPMAPDERRIIHLALADDPAVETVSGGRGFFKRVTIRPVEGRPRGFDRYNR